MSCRLSLLTTDLVKPFVVLVKSELNKFPPRGQRLVLRVNTVKSIEYWLVVGTVTLVVIILVGSWYSNIGSNTIGW